MPRTGILEYYYLPYNYSLFNCNLAKRHVGSLFAFVGIHPNDAKKATEEEFNEIKRIYKEYQQYIIGVGECGLDFGNENLTEEDKQVQIKCFEKQLEWAIERKSTCLYLLTRISPKASIHA